MKYYDLKQMINETNKSKSTINRFYKKNEDLKEETILKRKRIYPVTHVKYFDSELMFDENKILRIENQSMKNLIDCLTDKNSFPSKLWWMDWTFFGTVAYKLERNKKSCFLMMHSLYNQLENEFGNDTIIRLFFSTEPFANRKGYHNHFTVFISNDKLKKQIESTIQNFFSHDRVDLSIYNKYKPALFYIAKEGLHGEDWDILYNQLDKDKVLNNEDKSN